MRRSCWRCPWGAITRVACGSHGQGTHELFSFPRWKSPKRKIPKPAKIAGMDQRRTRNRNRWKSGPISRPGIT